MPPGSANRCFLQRDLGKNLIHCQTSSQVCQELAFCCSLVLQDPVVVASYHTGLVPSEFVICPWKLRQIPKTKISQSYGTSSTWKLRQIPKTKIYQSYGTSSTWKLRQIPKTKIYQSYGTSSTWKLCQIPKTKMSQSYGTSSTFKHLI